VCVFVCVCVCARARVCVCVCVCCISVSDDLYFLARVDSTPPVAEIVGISAKQIGHRSVLSYLWETKIPYSEYSLHIFLKCFKFQRRVEPSLLNW
jgi:hypothetical protein